MSTPKHKSPSSEDRTAYAPYNFVPLPEAVVSVDPSTLPQKNRYEKDRNTGHIDCKLTTLTPLYTRCALEPEEFEKQEKGEDKGHGFRNELRNKPDFFYTSNRTIPVIPGSSLRGMLRTLMEIITFSEVRWVNDEQTFYRAVADRSKLGDSYRQRMQQQINGGYCPKVKAGYVSRNSNGFSITPAVSSMGVQYFRLEEDISRKIFTDLAEMRITGPKGFRPNPNYTWKRCRVWFQPSAPQVWPHSKPMYYGKVLRVVSVKPDPIDSWEEGQFIASGWIPGKPGSKGKHMHWIVTRKSNENAIPIPKEDIRSYKDAGVTERIKSAGKSGSVLPDKIGDEFACFYVQWRDNKGKDHTSVGHTPYFRLPYERTPLDFVPSVWRNADDEKSDTTAKVKGPTPKKKDLDLTEATFGFVGKEKGDEPLGGRISVRDAFLDPLAQVGDSDNSITPQILSGPKPTCFQQYLVQGEPDNIGSLRHYASSPSETAIRGHKLYWHKAKIELEDIKESKQVDKDDKQHTQLKPVMPGKTFRFRVDFENLSDVELGALLWALTLPSDSGRTFRHKLGMGKPLGMGSVEISATLHLPTRSTRYRKVLDSELSWYEGEEEKDHDSSKYIAALEKHIGFKTEDSKSERIQALLAMLEFPGPNNDLTEYKGLEKTQGTDGRQYDGRQYRDRRVLPHPLDIALESVQPAISETSDEKKKSPVPQQNKPLVTERSVPKAPQPGPPDKSGRIEDANRSAYGPSHAPEKTRPTAAAAPPPTVKARYEPNDVIKDAMVEKVQGHDFFVAIPGQAAPVKVYQQMHNRSVGEKVKVTVKKVGGDGQVKEVKVH